jgi:hypothetical protein
MMSNMGEFGEEPKIIIDEAGKSYMLETARWAKFLAIMGIIVMAFAALGVFGLMAAGSAISAELGQKYSGGSIVLSALYFILIAIFFYPMYTLLKFANLVKVAVTHFNQQQFDEAFRYLKNTFKFWGIYTLVLLFIYGIILVFTLTVAVTSSI